MGSGTVGVVIAPAVANSPLVLMEPMLPLAYRSSRSVQRAATGCLGILCVLGLSGCGSITANSVTATEVRFIHLSPDAPAVDLYMNGNGAAYNLSFGTVTSYIPVAPGEVKISAARTGSGQTLAAEHGTLGGSRQYTAVLRNTLDSLSETVYPDATAPAPPGMLALRVLHEAAAAGPIDVYLVPLGSPNGGSPTQAPISLLHDLSFGNTDGYTTLSADKTYTVLVVPAGAPPVISGNTTALSGVLVSGPSGAVRTLVLTAPAGPKAKALDGFVLDDFDTP